MPDMTPWLRLPGRRLIPLHTARLRFILVILNALFVVSGCRDLFYTLNGYYDRDVVVDSYDKMLTLPTLSHSFPLDLDVPKLGSFVAFSMRRAAQRVREQKIYDHDVDNPIYYIAGMNDIHGFVYDPEHDDVILIGKRYPSLPPLTMDDLAVALRARLQFGVWPLVSIDPAPGKDSAWGLHRVRFEGGIENTQFGADLVAADYLLKRVALGFVESGARDVRSLLELQQRIGAEEDSAPVRMRMWFVPVLSNVVERQNVVSVQGLRIAVQTEEVGLDERQANARRGVLKVDELFDASKIFARKVTAHLDEIGREHRSIARLRGMYQMVAIAHAIEKANLGGSVEYWYREFPLQFVATPQTLDVLWVERLREIRKPGVRYRRTVLLKGGVELRAQALRIRAGDVTALRDAVLQTRPSVDSLFWSFAVGEWVIPLRGGLPPTDTRSLLQEGIDLLEAGRSAEAISVLTYVVELEPELTGAYAARGSAYLDAGMLEEALPDLQRVVDSQPRNVAVRNALGVLLAVLGQPQRAIQQLTYAIDDGEQLGDFDEEGLSYIYANRAAVYVKNLDQWRDALRDVNRAIELNPLGATFFRDRGLIYLALGDSSRGHDDLKKAHSLGDTVAWEALKQ